MVANMSTTEYLQYSGQPLVNVCITFAILETFFIVAFIISWYFNNNRSNNTKLTLYLILAGYIFSFGGVILGTRMLTIRLTRSALILAQSRSLSGEQDTMPTPYVQRPSAGCLN